MAVAGCHHRTADVDRPWRDPVTRGYAAATGVPADRFLPPDDQDWPGHWNRPPTPWRQPDDPGVLAHARAAIAHLPTLQHDAMVARDVQRRPPADVSQALDISSDDERDLLHQARGQVRTRLDPHLAEHPREH